MYKYIKDLNETNETKKSSIYVNDICIHGLSCSCCKPRFDLKQGIISELTYETQHQLYSCSDCGATFVRNQNLA